MDKVPNDVLIFILPDAGIITLNQTVFKVPDDQQVAAPGSDAPPAQELIPEVLTFNGKARALHGRSFEGDVPEEMIEIS